LLIPSWLGGVGPLPRSLCPPPLEIKGNPGELPLYRVQTPEQDGCAMKKPNNSPRFWRRRLLQQGMLARLGLGVLPRRGSAQSSRVGATVQRYATLGRTGMRISDISFGGSQLGAGEGDLVRHALDLGINYFDSADSYRGGESETVIGEAVRGK